MIVDCHVHISAFTGEGHGWLSQKLQNSIAFRFMRWRLSLHGSDEQTERDLEAALTRVIEESDLDAAVVLAFDAVYDREGRRDDANTHLYVTNDYVLELRARHPKMLFGASVNPYRRDAIAELERCAKAGAALVKWLPIVQGFDPSDALCIPFYEALAHHKLPLLCHTGGEQSLPRIDDRYADPELLREALKRGVTVIAAHCGTRSRPGQPDYVPAFVRLCHEFENLYGDTAALNLPTRSYAYKTILNDPLVRERIVHGSDWPILPVPSPTLLGPAASFRAMAQKNWIQRDIEIKRELGFDDAYWQRAAKLLRLG